MELFSYLVFKTLDFKIGGLKTRITVASRQWKKDYGPCTNKLWYKCLIHAFVGTIYGSGPSPGFLRCKRWFLNHHAKIFAWWGNFFASLWLWQESLRNMFFEEKSLIFQEIIDLISGVDIIISAAWGQISACFKNLTPWFCSLENPG